MRCKWLAHGSADATATPSSLASVKSRPGITFLVPAYPGSHGKEPSKWVSVYCCNCNWPMSGVHTLTVEAGCKTADAKSNANNFFAVMC